VADDEAVALALVARAVGAVPGPFLLDAPDSHDGMGRWLRESGATAPRYFIRMLHGTHAGLESDRHVFALAGAELA
jgi:hypothetical protein